MAFWLTHGVAGLISFEGLAAGIAVMIKMLGEKGPTFAAQYFRTLIPHIQAQLVNKDSGKNLPSLDPFIKDVVGEVASSTNLHFSRRQQPPPRPGEAKGSGKGAGKEKTEDARQTWESDQSSNHPAKLAGVCIFHDPANGKSCRHADHCLFRHLDTRDKPNKRQYEAAVKDVARKKKM